MTRLVASDISDLGRNWPRLEKELLDLTGLNMIALAAEAVGLPPQKAPELLAEKLVAVVPDTSGGGLIPGFSQAVAFIVEALGAKASITKPDAQGLAEAKTIAADFILTSSDDEYICQNLKTQITIENGKATGQGFAQALFRMTKGNIKEQTVLIIGAGPVGSSAARHLAFLGARLIIYDLIVEKAQKLAATLPQTRLWSANLGTIPTDFSLILEASTSDKIWPEDLVSQGTLISAPGMPFSFIPSTRYGLWAEPLATGTAVMLLAATVGSLSTGPRPNTY
jgi:pyrrolysine biosynthesis protein PylD